MQCHDIHAAASDLLLLRDSTVTAVCATCHTLYLEQPAGSFDPGYPGSEAGTAAGLRAFEVSRTLAKTHDGHRLGLGSGAIEYSDGATETGDYIPHGDARLALVSDPAVSVLAATVTSGLYCGSCHAVHGGFSVTTPLPESFSSSLLRANPNAEAEVSVTGWDTDGGAWCVECHDDCAPLGAEPFHAVQGLQDCVSSGCHNRLSADWPHSGSSDLVP